MCGPFALALGAAAPSPLENLWRQGFYSVGRIFTYAVLGAAAAFFGRWLTEKLPGWTNVPAVLALVAGGFLVFQGLLATGIIKKRGVAGGVSCPGASAFKALLGGRSTIDVFLAGLFTGLLPCGLLYGMLALAGSSGHVVTGLVTMAVFGLGTVPGMVATGVGGSLLGLAARKRMHAIAAWCLVLTGFVSIARGAGSLSLSGEPAAGCPFCEAEAKNALQKPSPDATRAPSP
jgi:sulfite exporter TauE/SafE